MTREEWKALYYPVPATKACGTALEAAEHSLRKWRGIVELNGATLVYAHSDSCALCQFSKDENAEVSTCENCPLVLSGHDPCETHGSAWRTWVDGDCGRRMVAELEETVEWCKKQEAENAGQ